MVTLGIAALFLWIIIFFLPYLPWLTYERFDVEAITAPESIDLSLVSVIIPARNEELVIKTTLQQVINQGTGHNIILINDNSTDATASLARELNYPNLEIINGKPLPKGWSGKLWALEQGRVIADTDYILLLDADIYIYSGLVVDLLKKMNRKNIDFLSLMAHPPTKQFWEHLIMPAFIYFFKLLYPFRLANSSNKVVAAAAGGCILTKTTVLSAIGGFEALKGALIDDCTLARKVKDKGYRTWLGLTHSAHTVRPYKGLKEIWDMVARTAYNQLQYSPVLLMLCTMIMILAYLVPLSALFFDKTVIYGGLTLILMYLTYLPTILFYRIKLLSLFFIPLVGAMFLAMTWTSAIRYYKGERIRWRGRVIKK